MRNWHFFQELRIPLLGFAVIVLGIGASMQHSVAGMNMQDVARPVAEMQQTKSTGPAACVYLEKMRQTWKLLPIRSGIQVQVLDEAGRSVAERELKLEDAGDVTRVVAMIREGEQAAMLGLAMQAESSDPRFLEYRMALLEGAGASESGLSGVWNCSGQLIKRPVSDPFELLAVGLLGGDSLMTTFQDAKRGRGVDPDQIETHVFVNHCMVTGDINTQYYEASPAKRIKARLKQPESH